jgi:hypothetical protein
MSPRYSVKTAPIITTVLRATRRRLFVAILREQETRREPRRASRRRQIGVTAKSPGGAARQLRPCRPAAIIGPGRREAPWD